MTLQFAKRSGTGCCEGHWPKGWKLLASAIQMSEAGVGSRLLFLLIFTSQHLTKLSSKYPSVGGDIDTSAWTYLYRIELFS